MCVHTCAQCAYLGFQACGHVRSCTHERGHNWVRVHTHTSVFPGVYACTLVLMEGSDAPGGTERDHRQALPTPGHSANGALGACGQEPASAKPPRDTQRWGQGTTSPLRDGVVPEHADRLGALLGLQEGEFHQDGPLQGAGQWGSLAVNHRAHHRRVDDGPVRQPAGRRQSPGQTCVWPRRGHSSGSLQEGRDQVCELRASVLESV